MKINGAMYNGMSERYMDIMQYKSDPKEAEVLQVEGVTIEALDGDILKDMEILFQQLDSFTAKQLAEAAERILENY